MQDGGGGAGLVTFAPQCSWLVKLIMELECIKSARARAIKDKRFKRRKSRKFNGKKERMREEIKVLALEKEKCLEKNSELLLQNRHLKRWVLSARLTALIQGI